MKSIKSSQIYFYRAFHNIQLFQSSLTENNDANFYNIFISDYMDNTIVQFFYGTNN